MDPHKQGGEGADSYRAFGRDSSFLKRYVLAKPFIKSYHTALSMTRLQKQYTVLK